MTARLAGQVFSPMETLAFMDTPLIRPYRNVLIAVAGVWLIVAVASVGFEWSARPAQRDAANTVLSTPDIVLIAVVSGMVAIGSIMPGWSITIPPEEDAESHVDGIGPGGVVGAGSREVSGALASGETGPQEPVERIPAVNEPPDAVAEGSSEGPAGGASEGSAGDSEEEAVPVPLSPRAMAIERLGHAFLIGMMIRIAGTVALFLFSSYYMDASSTRIGIWVLAWHLVLLMTEVITLSREIQLPTQS